jgi:hypothetical protein
VLASLNGDLIRLFLGDLSERQKVGQVAIPDARALRDRLVQKRLGERRLVALIVPVPTVAVHVDDNVARERATEIHGKLHDLGNCLRILSVDVEDGDLEHLGDVGRVGGRARFGRGRREPNLIVHDDVDRTARRVGLELRQVQGLLHDAFTGKRRVTVDEDAALSGTKFVAHAVLLGASTSEHDGVYVLQVAGIEAQGEMHPLPARRDVIGTVAEVVLHVTAADVKFGINVLELAENLARALAEDVRQDVESASVRHTQDHLVGSVECGALDGERK